MGCRFAPMKLNTTAFLYACIGIMHLTIIGVIGWQTRPAYSHAENVAGFWAFVIAISVFGLAMWVGRKANDYLAKR